MQQTIALERATIAAPAGGRRPPRLLDRVRDAVRMRNYSLRTEQAYVSWAERYVRFHGQRHPDDLGEADIAYFLSHLVIDLEAPPATRNQAFAALFFLYREVLRHELNWKRVVARRHSFPGSRRGVTSGRR